jgi:hypothetical protein
MANKRFSSKIYTKEVDPVKIWALVTIGTAGACTLTRGQGITSVTRITTGQYKLLISNPHHAFLGGTITPMRASTYAHIHCQFEAETVNGVTAAALPAVAAREIHFSTWEGTGFINPTSGTKLYITLDMRNSSITKG